MVRDWGWRARTLGHPHYSRIASEVIIATSMSLRRYSVVFGSASLLARDGGSSIWGALRGSNDIKSQSLVEDPVASALPMCMAVLEVQGRQKGAAWRPALDASQNCDKVSISDLQRDQPNYPSSSFSNSTVDI